MSHPQVSASAQGKYRPRCPDILGPLEPGRLQVVVGRPPTGPTPAADRRVPVVAGARTARERSCRSVARAIAAAWLDRRLAVRCSRVARASLPGLRRLVPPAAHTQAFEPAASASVSRQLTTTVTPGRPQGGTYWCGACGRRRWHHDASASRVGVGETTEKRIAAGSLRRAERQGRQQPPGQAGGNTAGRSFLTFSQLLDWRCDGTRWSWSLRIVARPL